MADSEKITLKNVRLSFPRLFEPRAFEEGQKKRYEATFLLDPTDKEHAKTIKEIKKQAAKVAREKWPNGIPKRLPTNFGLADEEGLEYDGYEGMFYFRTARPGDSRPTVVNRDRTPLSAEDGVIYAGCYVNATVTIWAQDNQFGKRLNGNLRAVQFVKDGEAFGAPPVDAEEEFDELPDDEFDDDELFDDEEDEDEDDIPF